MQKATLFETHPLIRLIRQGEGPTLDFKKTISSAQKIAKTLVAFANSKGGRLLIGVRDNGTICGAAVEEEAYMIESAANFFCKPIIEYEIFEHIYQGLRVLEVIVPESNNKPHSAKDETGKWWVHIRVNDQCVLASKIVVDVLRQENNEEGAFIQFGSKEKALLEYLAEHKKITLVEYCKLLNLSRRRAAQILVTLIRAGIIRIHTTEKTEYYTTS